MTTELFRAVSQEELEDIRRTGRLRATESSCDGKHFALSIDDARGWGQALYPDRPFALIRVTLAQAAVETFYKWDRLDGIGPAFFATIDQLTDAQVSEVSP